MSDNPKYLAYLERKKLQDINNNKKQIEYANIDLNEEMKQILNMKEKKYDKNVLSREQRINLTILAELNNYASYNLTENKDTYFVISESRKENFAINDMNSIHIKKFGDITGYTFSDLNTFIDDVKLFGLETELNLYIEDVKKYGLSGLKRRDIIIADAIIDYITKLPYA
jgi:hypothetical protein